MSFTIKQFDGTSTNYLTSGKSFGNKTLGEMFPNCTIYEQGIESTVTHQQPCEGKIYFLINAKFEEEDQYISEPLISVYDILDLETKYVDCSEGKHGYDSIEEQLKYAELMPVDPQYGNSCYDMYDLEGYDDYE